MSSIETLKEKFTLSQDESGFLKTDKDNLIQVIDFLKTDLGFHYLIFITAVDLKENFEIVYGFRNLETGEEVFLKTIIGKDDTVPTISDRFYGAEWHEREVYDLFGIRFDGHPDLRRILLPDEYEGHPLRKDYPMDALFQVVRPSTLHEKIIRA